MGPHEKNIIEAAIRRRQPLPEAIAGAPELFWGLELYFEAFLELSTCRQVEMGPIPWDAVDAYARRHGFTGDGFDYLLYMVRSMDDAFLVFMREKLKQERADEEAKRGRPEGLREGN